MRLKTEGEKFFSTAVDVIGFFSFDILFVFRWEGLGYAPGVKLAQDDNAVGNQP